jgi:hypothetical protein
MNNADKPINPIVNKEGFLTSENSEKITKDKYSGLTKREYFAGLAMQGLCANSIPGSHHAFENLTKEAIMYADELLKQLETTQD